MVPSYLAGEDPEYYIAILNQKRFERIKEVYVVVSFSLKRHQVIKILEALMKKKHLQEVMISESYLCDVPMDLLARFVSNLNSVIFDFGTILSSSQIIALFKSISEGSSKIKKLNLNNLDLSAVKPEILSSAVNNLEEFSSYFNFYDDQQFKSLFEAMSRETNLKRMIFQQRGIDHIVDADIMARALNKLTELEIDLSGGHLSTLFRYMSDSTELKVLDLHSSESNIYNTEIAFTVAPNVLSNAISKLDTLYMVNSHLTESQIYSVFSRLQFEGPSNLDLGGCDIFNVPLHILKKVSKRLNNTNAFARRLSFKIGRLEEYFAIYGRKSV